ncbi:MAG: TlpA disulfide reductase family protein [Planctomycetota bacterium]
MKLTLLWLVSCCAAATHVSPCPPTRDALLASVAERAGSLSPAQPRRGASLRIRYDFDAPEARFAATQQVTAVLSCWRADGVESRAVTLVPDERGDAASHVAVGQWSVPDDASYVTCNFVTRADWDRRARAKSMIYDADGQPVRGARLQTVFDRPSAVDQIIDAELRAFPDHHAAYRTKWFVASVAMDASAHLAMVRADLESLSRAVSPGALWARSYGHMLLGEEASARPLIERLLTEHPTARATARAVSDYEYQAYAQQLTGSGPEAITAHKAATVTAHPHTSMARDEIRELSNDEAFPLATTQAVCEAWIAAEPTHPEPRLVWAAALLRHEQGLDRASVLCAAAITGMLRGDLRLCGDYAGAMTGMLLPWGYATAARIAMAREDYAGALAHATAAQRVTEQRTSATGHELEARAWEAVMQPRQAERAWARALCAGSTDARGALQRLHEERSGDAETFAQHLGKLLAKADAGTRLAAPSFSARDLGAKAVDLAELSGRVVVLNFWGLGCAPCKAEIPDLSRMVEDYAGREVVFVAFATDAQAPLEAYLADHPFAYRVVPSAGAVAGQYRVRSWPTHVVIDRRGRVAATFVGGGIGADARLRPVIDRLLDE